MKQIYLVGTGDYHRKYVMAYEDIHDAVRSACALNDCDAAKAADYIKALPFMYEQPKTVDLKDVQTVIDMAIKATICAGNAIEKVERLAENE